MASPSAPPHQEKDGFPEQCPPPGMALPPDTEANQSAASQSVAPPPYPGHEKAGAYPPPGQAPYPMASVYTPPGAPQPYAGYPPQGQGGYPPQGQGGYPPQGQGGYPPQTHPPPQGYAYPPPQQYPQNAQVYIPQPGQVAGGPLVVQTMTEQCRYNDHLGCSIFTMLCCCFCIGIVALIKSLAVRSANGVGDVETAKRESQAALRLNKIGIGIGIVFIGIYIGMVVAVNMLRFRSYNDFGW